MLLLRGGMDAFYIDESHDSTLYAVTAVAVPFLRPANSSIWRITWPDHLAAAKSWRKRIADEQKIPTSKELHGTKLVGGRGNFIYGKRQLSRDKAADAYKTMLSTIDFIPDESVITVVGSRGPLMYGHDRLERVMYALFQRMRSQCTARFVNAMVYFDAGHPEYRSLYRRATKNLPTGSRYGGTRNLPLDMFVEDGNQKDSAFCLFTQISDLVAYAALAKVRHERSLMAADQIGFGLHTLYDAFPTRLRNSKAGGPQRDGIVRLT